MKLLKRMLLINWQHYSKQMITFDMINFMAGKTGAGKSTLIDALQLVMLGDTTGHFFNKAANDKSVRTLSSYLYGEVGDDGDIGFEYLRTGTFTSYIALEFEDTIQHQKFVTGLICDCQQDHSFDHHFFVIRNQGIPKNDFVNELTNTPYNTSELKSFFKRDHSSGFELCPTNNHYCHLTQSLFGDIKEKYRVLFKTAVPFKPITNIEKFITESICDVKSVVNIKEMQQSIRQYTQLEQDAKRMEVRLTHLERICHLSQQITDEQTLSTCQSYLVSRAELEIHQENELQQRQALERDQQKIIFNQEDIKQLAAEIQAISKEKVLLEDEYRQSDFVRKETELKTKIREINTKLSGMESTIQTCLCQLHTYGANWLHQASQLSMLSPFTSMFEQLQGISDEEASNMDFMSFAKQFKEIEQQIQSAATECKHNVHQLQQELDDLRTKIAALKKGEKPFPPAVLQVKSKIEKELREARVAILADVIEIKDEKWRHAIEGYLTKQKFYLLVDEEHFQAALLIYKQLNQSDVGLIDVAKLKEGMKHRPVSQALSEEIETNHEMARLYIDYLLGHVVKCEQVSELRKYPTAITPDCMLYKGFVARKMNPRAYETPYIGKKAFDFLLTMSQDALNVKQKHLQNELNNNRLLTQAIEQTILNEFEAKSKNENFMLGKERPSLHQRVHELKMELEQLDLTYIEKLREQLQTYANKIEKLAKKDEKLKIETAKLEVTVSTQNAQHIELLERITQGSRLLNNNYSKAWQTEVGDAYIQSVKNLDSWSDLMALYTIKQRETEERIKTLIVTRIQSRGEYNKDYKMSHDINASDNIAFENEFIELSDYHINQYLSKIKDSKAKAYNQFKDDFLAKLKSNIEIIEMQIKELNQALKQSAFGTDRYHFTVQARPDYQHYYRMIMDPMLMDVGAYNLMSESFNKKYESEIAELFKQIIYIDEESGGTNRMMFEKNIEKFTDYKTYLVFDLIVTNEYSQKQRLSKTLLSKSGGETQVPFYIAMLASFSQVCRIQSKNHHNTIRLIMLDEAFSKMDGERIQECIHLLRRFGLQAIFSAPTDKIPDIAPFVDKNIIVIKEGHYAQTYSFSPKELENLMEESDELSEMGA